MTTLTLVPSAAPRSRLALWLGPAANETGKGLRLMWRRRGMVAVGLAMNGLTYLGVSLFIGGGHLVKDLMVLTLPGLLALLVAGTASIQGSGGIAEEINGGTLEQTQLGPAAPAVQLLGRMAALAVEGLAVAVILGVVLVLGYDLPYDWHPTALLPAVLTLADGLGYGLLMAALTVRVASIGAITHVFNMVIMIFGGMMIPVTAFPAGVETFAHVIPTSLGVQALNTALAGEPLSVIWADGTLPGLLAHVTALFTAGLLVYVAAIRRARREGGLGPR